MAEEFDDLFEGPLPEEEIYQQGPEPVIADQEGNAEQDQGPEEEAGPVAAKRKKPGRGRPSLEDVARRKTRERVARFRAKQNLPVGRAKIWETNLAALSEAERAVLLAKQIEASVLTSLMDDFIVGFRGGEGSGVLGETMFPLEVYEDVKSFISQPGNLVHSWSPDLIAQHLTAADWSEFDDDTYKNLGLRTKIIVLFWREFLRHFEIFLTGHPGEAEPCVLEEVQQLRQTLEPLPEPHYVAEKVEYVSEKDREAAIKSREMLREQSARFQKEMQLGITGETRMDGREVGQ